MSSMKLLIRKAKQGLRRDPVTFSRKLGYWKQNMMTSMLLAISKFP